MSAVTELATELLNARLDRFPTLASLHGIPGREGKLPDYSEESELAFAVGLAGIAARAAALDPADFDRTDRITRSIVQHETEAMLAVIETRSVEYSISDFRLTPLPTLLQDLTTLRIGDSEQADGHLARLCGLPALFSTLSQRHSTGIAAGRLPVTHLVQAAIGQLGDLDMLSRPPSEAVPGFAEECMQVVNAVVGPALAKYRETLTAEVLPHGRDTEHAGLCWLPDGDRAYAAAVRRHTTTDSTPEQLHELGLGLIAELAEEYRAIGARVFDTDNLDAIFARLRDDPELRWTRGKDMLDTATKTVRRAEAAAAPWFRRLPTKSCLVAEQPATVPPEAPNYYFAGALDGTRHGTYFVNTKRPTEMARYQAEVVAFHEAVPGHHFEITTRQERTDLPLLRQLVSVPAFTEGWALYAERLADEMGLYSSDLARLGMLAYDSRRAARLVDDTGLNALGWSRQRAVRYLREHTPLTRAVVDSEVDRYLADPGQALAYMVGRLEIRRLRGEAERALGSRFDLRDFHEAVLGEGRLPLTTLAEVITEWIGDRP